MKVIIVRGRAVDPAVNKIAKCLSNNGYEVELLLWNRKNTPIPKESGYKISTFDFNAPQNNARVFFYFPIWWLYELIYLIRSDADIIHACDLDTLYPAILVKILKRKRMAYTIYDFYANNLPKIRFPTLRKIIWWSTSQAEKIGIRFSDLLMLVDESRYEEVQGASIKNLVYIYNSPPDSVDHLHHPSRSETSMQIFYSGSINKLRGIHDMVEALQKIDDVELILGGIVDDMAFFENMMESSKNVRFIGWIETYSELLERTETADVLFRFSDPNHPKTQYESPNKLFEAMMCGKPIIVSDDSSMANIVRSSNCGCVVPFGDIPSIVRAVEKLRDNPSLRQKLGANGRKAYDESYSWNIMEANLIAAYKQMVNAV